MHKLILIFSLLSCLSFASEVRLDEEAQNRIAYFTIRQQTIIEKTNKNFKRLLKRIQSDRVIGLELIVAARSKSQIQSRFGHTLLRFVDNKGSAGNDLVLSFVADLDGPEINNRRGVFGGYPVYPLLKTFREFNADYIKNENRSLERHIIPSTPKMRVDLALALTSSWQNLVDAQMQLNLKQIAKAKAKAIKKAKRLNLSEGYQIYPVVRSDAQLIVAWNLLDKETIVHIEPVKLKVAFTEEFGKYKFLGNNCAGALVKLIQKSQFPNRGRLLWAGRIPIKIPTYFEKSFLNPYPKKSIPSLEKLKTKIVSILSINNFRELYSSEIWSKDLIKRLEDKLETSEKLKLIDAFKFIPSKARKRLLASLPPLSQRPTYDEIYSLGNFPKVLYSVCEDTKCAGEVKSNLALLWSNEELDYKKKRLNKLLKKLKKNKLKEKLRLRPKVLTHFKYLFLN